MAFLSIAALVTAGILVQATERVDAKTLGSPIFLHALVAATSLTAFSLLATADVALDAVRREVAVVRRVLDVQYARTTLPLEVVTRFVVEEVPGRRGPTSYVSAVTDAEPLKLVAGSGARAAAETLNRALATSAQ